MARVQPRRLRHLLAAVTFTLVLTYLFYSRSTVHEPVTWPSTPPKSPSSPLQPAAAAAADSEKVESFESQHTLPPVIPAEENTINEEDLPNTSILLPTHSSASLSPTPPPKNCIHYEQLQKIKQEPFSEGRRKFPYSRPSPECRTFNLPSLENLLERMKGVIKDPDLYRLFENSYPNTLDTTIKWRGYANATNPVTGAQTVTDEELAFVITGDIDAMWLRDSASQIHSYLPLLEASSDSDSLASLWRGVINIHARYIIISPYCHSFQPPPESGVAGQTNGAFHNNHPNPPYDPAKVFDCKWELDSLASFLQISTAYYQRTNDLSFFQKYSWIKAVQAAVDAAGAMRLGTYSTEGKVEKSAWTFTGWTSRGSETLTNDGLGNPTKANGMVRTAFRPSDDACIYQLLVPANMMWAKYLEEASLIMEKLEGEQAKNLTSTMREFAYGIRRGIDRDAVVHHRKFGDIFAYEIDGYGGANLMDDANVPSLLAMPLWNYTESAFKLPPPPEGEKPRDYAEIYSNTRKFVLSDSNPYYAKGPVLSAVGGPHLGPGRGWPMAAIITSLTAYLPLSSGGKSGDAVQIAVEDEVKAQLRMVLDSTAGTGVVHESVNAWSESNWTRAWFGWANGLLGELIIKIEQEAKKRGATSGGMLGESWQ